MRRGRKTVKLAPPVTHFQSRSISHVIPVTPHQSLFFDDRYRAHLTRQEAAFARAVEDMLLEVFAAHGHGALLSGARPAGHGNGVGAGESDAYELLAVVEPH